MNIFDTGALDGVKIAALGPHVDAAVRELRARGHDMAAKALLASASSPVRSVREGVAVMRIARSQGVSPVVLKGVAQAISGKPGMWDELISRTAKTSTGRSSELAGYARGLVEGKLERVSPSAAHDLWRPRASVFPEAVGKKMSAGMKAALVAAGLLATAGVGYGINRALTPKRYDNDRV